MVKEYKDWLFVSIPVYASNPWVINNGKESVGLNWYDESRTFGEEGNTWSEGLRLPPGSYQIIGKGDQLTESDWEGIMETFKSSWGTQYYPEFPLEKIQGSRRTKPGFDKATPSGHSLLRSLGIEPSTTLVLKKQ